MQCTVKEDTSILLAEVNPLAHFNAKWHNSQLNLELPQLPKITEDIGEALAAPMYQLVKTYADVITKPS